MKIIYCCFLLSFFVHRHERLGVTNINFVIIYCFENHAKICDGRELELQPHVAWIDNFSKNWRVRMVGLTPDAMKRCLWTCVAYKKFAYPLEVSMAHMHSSNGKVIPAMPTNAFEGMVDFVQIMKSHTQEADGSMLFLYDTSLLTTWDCNRVPIQGNPELMAEPYRSSTSAHHDRGDDLYPRGLERENIGSNIGLAQIMRRYYNERRMASSECTTYSAMTVDVNIFDRIMKVG